MEGIEKLRSSASKLDEFEGGAAQGVLSKIGSKLLVIADQIEREHAEALAAAKRDLTDEAREVVERLRAIDTDECEDVFYCWDKLIDALGTNSAHRTDAKTLWSSDMALTVDRLCDLIEHGGGQDVDVAALLEVAEELECRSEYAKNSPLDANRIGIVDGIGDAPERIRKAVENAPKPDVDVAALMGLADKMEKDANKAVFDDRDGVEGFYTSMLAVYTNCIRKAVEGAPSAYERLTAYVEQSAEDSEREAAADWVEAQGGLDVVKAVSDVLRECVERRDEVLAKFGIEADDEDSESTHDAIMAELERRLMPPGMEWPGFEDGERIEFGSAVDGLGEPCEKFIFTRSMGYVCQLQDADGNMANVFCGNRLARPEPEVLGADKLPILKGETVYIDAAHAAMAGKGPLESDNECGLLGVDFGDALDVMVINGSVARFDHLCGPWCPASWLTHTDPETQERIDEDARKDLSEYWECGVCSCEDCPAVIDGKKPWEHYGLEAPNCGKAIKLDLLRRQRELDAKTMGGE